MTKCKLKIIIFAIVFFAVTFLSIAYPAKLIAECSLWAAISDKVPEDIIIDHLLNSPNSLKSVAKHHRDGWGIGYYDKDEAKLLKGIIPADIDQNYNVSVLEVSRIEPKIIVAHVRTASSGCRDNVVNPHPFKRIKNGKQWLFGHNGTLDKNMLIDIIGEDYFNKNLPNTCTYDPPDSWVDSELYFIFLIEHIEENGWNVERGIKEAILKLTTVISGSGGGLNFFLTDGDTLWSFRKGRSLYYYYQLYPQFSAVATQFPYAEKGGWIEVPEDSLVVMESGLPPVLKSFSVPVAQSRRSPDVSSGSVGTPTGASE